MMKLRKIVKKASGSNLNAFFAVAITIVAGFAASSLYAYTWTGGANDGGLWTTPRNWYEGTGYPSSASDNATFTNNAAVLLDGATTIGYVRAKKGTVTISGTTGSSLNCTAAVAGNASGLTVDAGATLIVSVPMPLTTRFDKWNSGTLIVRNADITKSDTTPWYVAKGTNIFDGTTSVSIPNERIVFGNDNAPSYMPVYIRDSASFSVKGIDTAASTADAPSVDIVQDGADTVVTAGVSGIVLRGRVNDRPCYTLRSGTLSSPSFIAMAAPPSGKTYTQSPTNLWYVQEGGTSTFTTVTLEKGSAALRGGVMNISSLAAITVGSGCAFKLEGGTLALSEGTFTSWSDCRDKVAAKCSIAPGSSIALGGTSSLSLPRDASCSTFDIGLGIGEGKTVEISSGTAMYAPRFSTNAWNLTLNNGSILKLANSSSRILTPLNLTVNGTGKILFNSHRGAVVAHRLVVDGVEKAKGLYWKESNSFVDGGENLSDAVVVPHVWTGAGDGTSWNDPNNWDANTVPNGDVVAADISRASSITLNDNISLGCLVAMPNGASRKVTVTGSGKISLCANQNYCCGVVIPKDCELILDVGLERNSNNTLGMSGGGRLTLTKTAPSTGTGAGPLFAFDGTLALRGVQTLVQYTGSSYNHLTYWSYEGQDAELLIDEGTTISTARFTASNAGYAPLSRVRQIGGSVTLDNNGNACCYIQTFNKDSESANTYYLENGTLTVNGVITLGRSYLTTNVKNPRYPGGSFEMSGGTLDVKGFAAGFNQNYVRLYGGDVYLKGDCSAALDRPDVIAVTNMNDYTYYLGGVTIHPSGGASRKLSSGNMYLTGKNGDTVFDVSQYGFDIAEGNTVAGPGGIVVTGVAGKSVSSSASFTFTGAITVKGGNITCFYAAPLNGPSALIVENASSVATFGRSTSKDLDKVVLAAASCLSVSSGETFRTKRLVVGGAEVPAGTYTGSYGAGTVIVGSAPASWEVGGVGNLSWFADGTSTTVDAATTLSSLTYDPATAGQTNTLTGAALTFADEADIYVARGNTLVIGNDVTLGGKVRKTGLGEVVFNGAVSGVATPTESSDATDPRWLTVVEGGATFDGSVQGVRLVTCGNVDAFRPPVITLSENCTVSNYGIVLTAWSETSAACCGETHQEGATVDYSTTIFTNLVYYDKGLPRMHALTKPNSGGYGRYVLDDGVFNTSSSLNFTFVLDSGTLGTFEFVQNGGRTVIPCNFTFARHYTPTFTYTLNGGRFEIGKDLGGVSKPSCNVFNLNGGTYAASYTYSITREMFTLNIGGEVTFEVASGKTLTIADDPAGEASFAKTGAGALALDGFVDLDGLDVQAGTVTLCDRILPALDGTADLSIAKSGATLNLDNDGTATFKTLQIGALSRGAGTYSTTRGAYVVRSVLSGSGELQVLEGSDPGALIIIR